LHEAGQGGPWRTGNVPGCSTDAGHAYVIDERMKELGRLERYEGAFQNYEGATSSTGMGDTGAAKQSGVKGFGETREE
jgi:hypothetical protein